MNKNLKSEIQNPRSVKPIVAIVGRPNVGKSSLFNLISGEQISVVHDFPGVTRDRIYADVEWNDRHFTIVDTGGLDVLPNEELIDQVQFQVDLAIAEASVTIFLVDVREGVMPHDGEIAKRLREYDKPLFIVANKVDHGRYSRDAIEFYELGFDRIFEISCTHNSGVGDLLDEVVSALPTPDEIGETESSAIKISIVGRPNVGKSSITNAILGEDRMIVNNAPGTTRDAVNIKFDYNNIEFELIDTAGMRRKSSIKEDLERSSVLRAIRSIRQSDIAWLVLDASDTIAKQEKTIANFIERQGTASILIVNKWDLIEKKNETHGEFVAEIKRIFPQLSHVPILFVSALTGQRVTNALDLSLEIYREYSTRIPTPDLNGLLRHLIAAHPPPRSGKVRPNLKYITQIDIQPPTFIIFASHPKKISKPYESYLINNIRSEFGFAGTPIKIFYRSTNRR